MNEIIKKLLEGTEDKPTLKLYVIEFYVLKRDITSNTKSFCSFKAKCLTHRNKCEH